MRNARTVVLSCAVAIAGGCGGAPPAPSGSISDELATTPSTITVDAQRPASVPADFVATPNGWFHHSCVYEIGDDEEVRGDVIAKRDGRSSRAMKLCTRPHYDFQGRALGQAAVPPPADGGWIMAVAADTVPVNWLSASWTVPHEPLVNAGIVYFFPGLEHKSSNDLILQPVLAHNGADAPGGWAIYSWNCCPGNNAHHSRAIAVQPGEAITGFMHGQHCDTTTGVCSDWTISTATASADSRFEVHDFRESMDWVFSGVLESYSVNSCNQYPPDNQLTFSNVTVTRVGGSNGGVFTPSWEALTWPATPGCSASMSATANSATLSWCRPRSCSTTQCGTTIADGCGGTITCAPCSGGGVCPSGMRCCQPGPNHTCNECIRSTLPCPVD
jgi:hypothetical protein